MVEQAFTISFRVRHPVYPHHVIVQSLDMAPKFAHTVGAPRMTPRGEPLDGVYKETYCSFSLIDRQNGWFTDGVNQALPSLASHREFLRSISDTGGCAELYVGVFVDGDTTGFTMDIEMMAALADLRVQLSAEFYCD